MAKPIQYCKVKYSKNKNFLKKRKENWSCQGNISCKDGYNKAQNSKDLTELEDINKRWQEYTEEQYKKCLNDPENNDGVVTHEPEILEYELKGAIGNITTNKGSGGDGIPANYFKS